MFEIKHTVCPSCSVGCGINVILDGDEVVGSFPYKRNPINEGKNCSNGRDAIENAENEISFNSSDLKDVIGKLKSSDNDKITVVFSGNNSNEDLQAIKSLCDSKGFNCLMYADNLKNFDSVASYDEIENASKVFVIGNILYDNPLIGRRIFHAKKNGANIFVNDDLKGSPTANIADEFTSIPVSEFLENNKADFGEDSVIVFNKVDSFEDLELIENAAAKVLPVYSKANTKGALSLVDAVSKEDAGELLNNTEVLLIFNDDIVDELDFDFNSIKSLIAFSQSDNSTTEISEYVIPVKSWLECDGSFTNSEGLTQEFNSVYESSSDKLSIAEIIENINGELE